MSTQVLFAQFDRIIDAPDAVVRIRRFILDLAVRGDLVKQDPNEEPASVIVGRLTSSKSFGRALREGETARLTPTELPISWQWLTLGSISEQITDGEHATPPRIHEHQVPLVTAKNVRDGLMAYENTDWVSFETATKAWARCRPTVGDILLVCVGATTGRLCVLREARDMVLVRSVALIRPTTSINVEYLALALRSPMCQRQIWKKVKVTAQPCLYINRIRSLSIPLPPLPEQTRIVGKVGELMTLCDELQAARAERERHRDRLTAASHHLLANRSDAGDFRKRARFFVGHLPQLTIHPDQIKQLRQSILNLAVRGQIVHQDPNDEPASELLKRILSDKAHLLSKGTIKKERSVPHVDDSTIPFTLPNGWVWARLGHLTRLVTSGSRDWAKFYSTDGAIFVRMGNLSRDSYQLRLANIQRVKPPTHSEGARTKLEEGDILISITGEVGLLGLIPPNFGEAYINQHTCLVRPMARLGSRYLAELFRSPFAQSQFDEPQRGLKNSFRLTDVTQFLVPLPPLSEQHRIVTKVDELMALCNRLEEQLGVAQSSSLQLLEATLNRALNSTPVLGSKEGSVHDPQDPLEGLDEHRSFDLAQVRG
jgi:type I restriction enzyme, S subunit